MECRARAAGVVIHDNCEVQRVDAAGGVAAAFAGSGALSLRTYTWVVNACGPWAVELLERSGIPIPVQLDLVGGHLLVPPPPGIPLPEEGLFVEVPGSRRIAFLLPYKGELLVGTTEQAQQLNEPSRASPLEQEDLLGLVSHYLPPGGWHMPNSTATGLRGCCRSCALEPMCRVPVVRLMCNAMAACSRCLAVSGLPHALWLSVWQRLLRLMVNPEVMDPTP